MLRNKIWSVLLVCIVLASMNFFTNYAKSDSGIGPLGDNCAAYATTPYKSGSVIIGGGKVECGNPQNIRVVYALQDNAGHQWPVPSGEKTCSNSYTCTWQQTAPYVSGRSWRSSTSGYAMNWQGFMTTIYTPIP